MRAPVRLQQGFHCDGSGENEAQWRRERNRHFTSSFHWARKLAAICCGMWFLMTDSAVTDAQSGGLTFVTAGIHARPCGARLLVPLARNIYVGNTQPNTASGVPENPAASNAGPFNPFSEVRL